MLELSCRFQTLHDKSVQLLIFISYFLIGTIIPGTNLQQSPKNVSMSLNSISIKLI